MTSDAAIDGADPRAGTSGGRRLPRLLILTDRHQAAASLGEVVAAALHAGARAVVLREKDLPEVQRRVLAAQLAPLVHDAGGVLLSAGTHLPDADGVHQPASGGTVGAASIVGRSCHDADDLRTADADGVDYVTISPVHATTSKPGYGPALGIDGLASLLAATTVPAYALGGIETPGDVAACRSAGAHGVAVMGAIMRVRRPGPLVAELVAAAETGRT